LSTIKKIGIGALALVIIGAVVIVLTSSSDDAPTFDPDIIQIIVPDDMPEVERIPVTVTSGQFDLEAELIIPQGGRDQKPAVVFSPGSSAVTFHDYSPGFIETFVEGVFLSNDMAVLLMNKRGIGQSEGHWQQNSIEGRADDVYAAIQFLQNHPAIDPAQVGVIGHSQGGWVSQLVAARHDDVAFFISLAGPATTVEEQIEQSSRNDFQCAGYDDATVEKKTNSHMRTIRTSAAAGNVIPVGDLAFMANILTYDPRDALQSVDAPGLLVFGESDILVPVPENQARLDEIFPTGLPDNLAVTVVAQSTHGFHLVSDPCISWTDAQTTPFSTELVDTLNNWLADNGFAF